MAILDILKKRKIEKKERERKETERKEKPVKKKEKKEKEAKEVRRVEERKEAVSEKRPPGLKKREGPGEVYRILKSPQVTEKATALAEKNQYIFKVWPKANKTETKKAIEDLYGVDVTSVKMIKVPRKRRRLGRIPGWRKQYKKAIVKIKKGQKIEVMPR